MQTATATAQVIELGHIHGGVMALRCLVCARVCGWYHLGVWPVQGWIIVDYHPYELVGDTLDTVGIKCVGCTSTRCTQ